MSKEYFWLDEVRNEARTWSHTLDKMCTQNRIKFKKIEWVKFSILQVALGDMVRPTKRNKKKKDNAPDPGIELFSNIPIHIFKVTVREIIYSWFQLTQAGELSDTRELRDFFQEQYRDLIILFNSHLEQFT